MLRERHFPGGGGRCCQDSSPGSSLACVLPSWEPRRAAGDCPRGNMTRQSNGVQFPAFPSREQICQGLLLAPSPAQDSRVNSEYPQLPLALLLQISPSVKVFFFFFGHVTDTSKKCATSKLPWPHSCVVDISQQVGATHVSVCGRTDKMWERHTTLFSLKKEGNSDIYYNMDEP